MPDLDAYARHSRYTDPGTHAALLAEVGTSPVALHQAACEVILHYRAERDRLTPEQLPDIDLRWLSAQLDVAQERHAGPLAVARQDTAKLAGCCRDHTLLAVGVLREHGVPARSRVGFAGYFREGFHHDHVVVERWDGARWVRHDTELGIGDFPFDVTDLPTGPGAPFETAAEVWLQARAGQVDPMTYGVDPALPELCGTDFLLGEVFLELAHRQRDEVLLWDVWGPGIPPFAVAPGTAVDATPREQQEAAADEIAHLLVAADAGDEGADAELDARYAANPALRPDAPVVTLSPLDRIGDADLVGRTTRWR